MPYTASRSIEGVVAVITGVERGHRCCHGTCSGRGGSEGGAVRRRKERLDALGEELDPDRVIGVPGDVRDAEHNQALVKAAVARWGRLDMAIANAGIGAMAGSSILPTSSCARWSRRTTWGPSGRCGPGRANCARKATAVMSSSSPPSPASVAERTRRSTRGQSTLRWAWVIPRPGTSRRRHPGHAGMPGWDVHRVRDRDWPEEGSSVLESYLRPEDVAHAIRVVLEQPRSVRTTVWQLWSMEQQS